MTLQEWIQDLAAAERPRLRGVADRVKGGEVLLDVLGPKDGHHRLLEELADGLMDVTVTEGTETSGAGTSSCSVELGNGLDPPVPSQPIDGPIQWHQP